MERPTECTDALKKCIPGALKKFIRILSAAFNTLVVVYPFYALISRLSVLDPKVLKACSNHEGCTFIRYWGTPELPRTAPKFLPHLNTTDMNAVFVTVRNGRREFEVGKPNWYQKFQRGYTQLAIELSTLGKGGGPLVEEFTGIDVLNETNWQYKEPMCPGKDAESMLAMCEEERMKENVSNHLEKASSLKVYLMSIPIWAVLRLMHDVLLILDTCPEVVTLVIGFLSLIPQVLSFAAGFLWAIGAAEVFWSSSLDHGESCGCYYELRTIPMFVLISTPVGLYMATRNKLSKLGYACLFGDYLYCTSYEVPYRVVSQYNSDTTYGFLSLPVDAEGEQRTTPKVGRKIRREHYRTKLATVFQFLINAFNLTALYFVYAFAFPTLTVRFYDAVVVNVLQEGYQVEDIGAIAFAIFLLGAPLYVCMKQIERLRLLLTAVVNEMRRVQALSSTLDSDARHFKRYTISMPCISGPVNSLGLFSQALTMMGFSFLAMWMLWPLWHGRAALANTAGDLGAGGFMMMTAFLNSWVPSDTPLNIIQLAIQIKGGRVPKDIGLQEIIDLNKWKPQLGLQVEAECASRFIEMNPESPLALHGLGLEKQDEDTWVNFLDTFLESKALESKAEPLTGLASPP